MMIMKMKALATLAVSMFAYSAEAAPKPVKVMTYNIRYSDGDRNSPDNSWEARRADATPTEPAARLRPSRT